MKFSPLAVLGLLLAASQLARAQFDYTITDNSATIIDYTGRGGPVVVPSTLGGAPVVAILADAFETTPAQASIPSIQIPATVTNIESGAFSLCKGLLAINVNTSNAYYTSISGVLYDHAGVTLMAYPGGLTGTCAIANGVTGIASYAFYGDHISAVTIPASVNNIGALAFGSCLLLFNINVNPGNATFSSVNGVLFDDAQTTLIQCPGNLPGTYTIPTTVNTIADYAFGGCHALTSINVPSSVSSMGQLPFFNCASLKAINVDAGNLAFSSINGVLFDAAQTTLLTYPSGLAGSYVVPAGVTTIEAEAFNYAPLSNVTFPPSLTSIQDYAFAYCQNLDTATFEGNVPTFDDTAFEGDTGLQFYYLNNTQGWTSPLHGVPALVWNPVIQTSAASPAIVNTNFGFTITGTSNLYVSVQGTTNLASGPWQTLQTITLTNGSVNFSAPADASTPGAFFRLSTP